MNCTCGTDEDSCPLHKHLNEQAICGRDHDPDDLDSCPNPGTHRKGVDKLPPPEPGPPLTPLLARDPLPPPRPFPSAAQMDAKRTEMSEIREKIREYASADPDLWGAVNLLESVMHKLNGVAGYLDRWEQRCELKTDDDVNDWLERNHRRFLRPEGDVDDIYDFNAGLIEEIEGMES